MSIATLTRAAVLLVLLTAAAPGQAQESRTFTGVVIDELCAVNGHAAMRMGPTDAECAKVCAEEHEAPFVLLDGSRVYQLSDQAKARTFAGARVKVTGVLDAQADTIRVTAITEN
ncbi:MAG: DUF5818 domain-containing protein [Vicinamibacterales bacterium]